jgi:parallel beta-helix repeat protein
MKKIAPPLLTLLLLSALTTISIATQPVKAETVSPYPWPTRGHDQAHTGYSPGPAPNTNSVLWIYTVGAKVRSSPAVADGKVFFGAYDGNVYCLNETTGEKIWNNTIDTYLVSSPAIANGKLFIGAFYQQKLYCLNASNGETIWNKTTGSIGISSPAVVDGKVYVGSYWKKIYAINETNGDYIWSYTTGGTIWSSPAVHNGKVFVGSASPDNNIYCLNASAPPGDYSDLNPTILIWNYTTGDGVESSPAVADGMVFIGSNDKNIYCLDEATGAVKWKYTTDNIVISSPAVAYGKVYVGTMGGKILCLNQTSGEPLWNYTAGLSVYSSPAIADGKLYVGSFDHSVYCLNATNGQLIWSYTTGDEVHSSPSVADGRVFIGSHDNKVYCFGQSRNPIFIDGNSGFTAANGVVNPDAAGNASDPYIIENWDINASGTTGIEIRNTNAFFIIRNVTVYGGENGIILQNVQNGVIKNSKIENNRYGIKLLFSSNNILEGNRINDNAQHGVLLQKSENNLLVNNEIHSNGYHGLWIDSSKNNTVTGNRIYSNQVQGVELAINSDNTTVKNNIIKNNKDTSIRLWSSSNCTITENSLDNEVNNNFGIANWNSTNNIFDSNTISQSSVGIYLFPGSENNTIDRTAISNCPYSGISSENSTNTIKNSQITNCARDIELKTSILDCINTTFNPEKIRILDDKSTINVYWYLTVYSENGVEITIKDSNQNQVFSATVTQNGKIEGILLQEYSKNSTTGTLYTPHNVTATYGTQTRSVSLNMNQSRIINLELNGSLLFTVKDAVTNLGLNGVNVSITGPVNAWGLTDTNGVYSFSGIPPGNYSYLAKLNGYIDSGGTATVNSGVSASITINLVQVTGYTETVTVDNVPYLILIETNVSISAFTSNASAFSFNVSATDGSVGYCNITVPSALNTTALTVYLDSSPITPTITSNGTDYFIYFTFNLSSHLITVGFAPQPEAKADGTWWIGIAIAIIIAVISISIIITLMMGEKKREKRTIPQNKHPPKRKNYTKRILRNPAPTIFNMGLQKPSTKMYANAMLPGTPPPQ